VAGIKTVHWYRPISSIDKLACCQLQQPKPTYSKLKAEWSLVPSLAETTDSKVLAATSEVSFVRLGRTGSEARCKALRRSCRFKGGTKEVENSTFRPLDLHVSTAQRSLKYQVTFKPGDFSETFLLMIDF